MVSCVLCEATALKRHHLTERDDAGRYLDPDFILPLCHDHHELLHDDLRTLGLHGAPVGNAFDRDDRRKRATSAALVRLLEIRGEDPVIRAIAEQLPNWADEHARAIRVLDERYPGWREDPALH